MPLNADSPIVLHFLQNASLIALAGSLTPLCTFIAFTAHLISRLTPTARHTKHQRTWRASSSTTFRPRTILVTGVGMAKGLAIARAFYKSGHRVIGADFEPYYVPVSGRFSVSLEKFCRLRKPSQGNAKEYIESLIEIIQANGVELWVSCSGVASAIEDALAAEKVQEETKCRCIQFDREITEMLHEKHSFIENTRRLELNVPETHLVKSVDEALGLLYPGKTWAGKAGEAVGILDATGEEGSVQGIKYILKPVGMDDTARADLTLLPRPTRAETDAYLKKMKPSPSRPFVLQQFIQGPEYCTHSLIIRGEVKLFTACRSQELLMHYQALPSTSVLHRAFLEYTRQYAEKMGEKMTGHFSIDFLLDTATSEEKRSGDVMDAIYPIECNPRAHTAVVLFADDSDAMSEAYLSALPDYRPLPPPHHTVTSPDSDDRPNGVQTHIVTASTTKGYYWIGHDIVTRLILPVYFFLTSKYSLLQTVTSWVEFAEHLFFWRDGTFEVWDPWPAWWLYVGYWPGMWAASLVRGGWWSRCNVSTTKMFAV